MGLGGGGEVCTSNQKAKRYNSKNDSHLIKAYKGLALGK